MGLSCKSRFGRSSSYAFSNLISNSRFTKVGHEPFNCKFTASANKLINQKVSINTSIYLCWLLGLSVPDVALRVLENREPLRQVAADYGVSPRDSKASSSYFS